MAGTPAPLSKKPGRASLLLRLATPAELCAAELHPQGALLLAGAQSGDVLLFATSSGGLVQRLAEPKASAASAATCVAWAEFGRAERVVAGHKSGSVRVWDVEHGTVLAALPAHRADVGALAAYPPLGLLATGSADTNIKLWGMAGLAHGGSSDDGGGGGGGGGSGGTTRLAPLQVLKGHAHPITQLHFTPDGELLISGDAGGGLRVWQVAGGAAGRLLHDLSGQHSAAITGIACHPEERLFATCSLDRTLRAWDMDSQAGKCIGVHGPEGCREVRALAFTSTGSALLAAYPDGLRTFTLDPLEHRDTAELLWKQITSIRYSDGKAIGVSLHKGDAGLFCVDLTKMSPFAQTAAARARSSLTSSRGSTTASSAVSSESSLEELSAAPGARLRFSEKHGIGGAASAAAGTVPPRGSNPMPAPAAWPSGAGGGSTGAGPAAAATPALTVESALAAARQRRQAAVLGPRAVNSGPAVEVFAAARRPAQPGSFTAARPAGGTLLTLPAPAGGRASPGSDDKGAGRPRLSAEENGELGGGSAASQKAGDALVGKLPGEGAIVVPADWQLQPAAGASTAMLDLGSHRGFLAVQMQRSGELQGALQAKQGLWRQVAAALRCGNMREAVRLLRDAGDLCVTANVVSSHALQRHPDRFSLELCSEAAPLARQLLGSACAWHHQAALQLLDAILGRWGGYLHDVLSSGPRLGKVDLELERRQERSRALRGRLQELAPGLERLAAPPGGGRAQQMLARLKAL
ncbi:hypothetical protein ABPG75_008884 [Micractinium tetrahymenae]